MKNFWTNKNVLITGVTGFIGGNLTKKIIESGANVFGLVRNNNPKCFLSYENLDKKIRLIQGDLNDVELLYSLITEERIDIIFHLAAQPLVRMSYIHPKDTFDVNFSGTLNILQIMFFIIFII